jgi:cobalt-precorrin 5A hydrolase
MKLAIIAITEEGKTIARVGSLKNLVGEIFDKFDGIIFIMALGIVMRVIAPYLKDKRHDPAIVVVDEASRFAISALSGHEGGANRLAFIVAGLIGAMPVITTASDTMKRIIVGIGCRKGVSEDIIKKANEKNYCGDWM